MNNTCLSYQRLTYQIFDTLTPKIEQSRCMICLKDYEKISKIYLLSCGHIFHQASDCLVLTETSVCHIKECPLCKRKIVWKFFPEGMEYLKERVYRYSCVYLLDLMDVIAYGTFMILMRQMRS